jgi:hypothetical protein
MTFTQFKTAQELGSLMLGEARKSNKCPNLQSVVVHAAGHPGDWDYNCGWSGPLRPLACELELLDIKVRLKKQGFGLKT